MSQNWMRHFELQLIDDKGDGISLSDFKVTFNIQKMPATIFNGFVGNFKIYNLSPETQNRIMGKEFTRVRAIAGITAQQIAAATILIKMWGSSLTVIFALPSPAKITSPIVGCLSSVLMAGRGISTPA